MDTLFIRTIWIVFTSIVIIYTGRVNIKDVSAHARAGKVQLSSYQRQTVGCVLLV